MADEIETLVVKLEARITDFEKKMAQAQRVAKHSSEGIAKTFREGLTKGLELVGIGLSARELVNIVKEGIEAGKAIADLSEKLGIGTDALQEFTFVAKENGASQEDIVAGFRGMTRFLGEASQGVDKATNLLNQLGLSFDNLKTKRPEQVFEILLDRIGKIENPLQRNATLMQVFGKSGTQLAQVANLGADGIDRMRAQAENLGVVMGSDTVAALKEAADKMDTLNLLWVKGEGLIAEAFIPALNDLVAILTSPEFASAFSDFAKQIGTTVETDIKDLERIVNIASGILDSLKNFGISHTSATDQPFPGPGGDQRAQRLGNAAGVSDFFNSDFAASSTGKLTTKTVEASKAFKDAQLKAQGLAGEYQVLGGVTDDQATAQKKAAAEAERAAKKYDEESQKLVFQTDQLGRSEREQAIYNAVNDAGADISTAAGKAIADQAARLYDLQKATEAAIERMDLFRDAAKTGLSTFISDLREGKTVLESLGDALDRITEKLIDFALDKVVQGLLGPAGGLGGGLLTGRASGGNLNAGQAAIVGENGPEIFVPRTGGVIGHARGGGGIVVETHYHNNAGVSVREKQSKTNNGVRLDVMIDDVVASKGADPSSKISRMLTSRGAQIGTIRR